MPLNSITVYENRIRIKKGYPPKQKGLSRLETEETVVIREYRSSKIQVISRALIYKTISL